MAQKIPIWQKTTLTMEEAAGYTSIGVNKLWEISNDERWDFVLWNGSKRLFKREKLESYLNAAYSI